MKLTPDRTDDFLLKWKVAASRQRKKQICELFSSWKDIFSAVIVESLKKVVFNLELSSDQ